MTLSRVYSILFSLAILTCACTAAHADEKNFSSWPEACAAAESVVSQGDLIFLDIPHFLFREVAKSTNSWASHVGVVFKSSDGRWYVAESAVPLSHDSDLCTFLQKSAPYRFEIRRFDRPLTNREVATMAAKAQSVLGKLYTFSFNFESTNMFCSKFAYLIYQSIGITVGRIETFRELLNENPKTSTIFWHFWFLGHIPWERKTITPASELNDPKFFTVLSGR